MMETVSSSGLTPGSTAVTSSPTQASRAEAVSQPATSATSGDIRQLSRQSQQLDVVTRYANSGRLTRLIAETDNAHRTLKQVYTGLEQLRSQLHSKPVEPASISSNIRHLLTRATQPGAGLNQQMLPDTQANRQVVRQLPDKIDFLSMRPHTEQINIMMGRSGQHVSIELAAGQSPQQNLASVQQVFSRQGIKTTMGDDNQLVFSALPAQGGALKEPWIMVGQGVRIAAGNPVSVSLEPVDHPLETLYKRAQGQPDTSQVYEQIKQVQQRVKEVLQTIGQQSRQLHTELQQLRQQHQTPASAADMQTLSEQVALQMFPARSSVTVIMSQAKATRNLVTFSLRQNSPA